MCDVGPSAGAQCSGATRAAIHHGAVKSACRNTPPVKCATLKTSDNASIPTFLSEAGVLVMFQGAPVIDPRPSGDLKIAVGFVSGVAVPKTIDTGPIMPVAEAHDCKGHNHILS